METAKAYRPAHAGHATEIRNAYDSRDRERLERAIAAIEAGGVAFTPAALDVLAERRRQVHAEGWDAAHDDEHDGGGLSAAAAAYALNAADQLNPYSQGDGGGAAPPFWPWSHRWWKPATPRRDLVKAAALILAEIERLDRAAK